MACAIAILFCLLGCFDGYVTRADSGRLQLRAFEWTTDIVLYTGGMWLAWVIGICLASYYKEPQLKWGARVLLSVPVAVFCLFALGLVEFNIPTRI